jgi:hypothetical protein
VTTAAHGGQRGRTPSQPIAALLTEPAVEAATVTAGAGLHTLRRWLREAGFAAEDRAARRAVVEPAVGNRQRLTARAVGRWGGTAPAATRRLQPGRCWAGAPLRAGNTRPVAARFAGVTPAPRRRWMARGRAARAGGPG